LHLLRCRRRRRPGVARSIILREIRQRSIPGWSTGLRCSAGKREFKLGRYSIAHIRNGGEFAVAMRDFRREVAVYRKTGFLAILAHDATRCLCAEDELRLLGETMHAAGLTDDAAALIEGGTLATPIDVVCPVTGEAATYEFFSVAFCRHAADPADPLYDPSLSAPFTAINTTSDAFAFAMLVRDQALKAWQKAPFEIEDRNVLDRLLRKCVTVWQNMSINTIASYNGVAAVPARAVCLSPDRTRWLAPHNDPVFAELRKSTHAHEMPIRYAARLAAKWSANLFEGKDYVPGRDGQSGGTPVLSFEDLPDAAPLPI
jgi:hypothetical protein